MRTAFSKPEKYRMANFCFLFQMQLLLANRSAIHLLLVLSCTICLRELSLLQFWDLLLRPPEWTQSFFLFQLKNLVNDLIIFLLQKMVVTCTSQRFTRVWRSIVQSLIPLYIQALLDDWNMFFLDLCNQLIRLWASVYIFNCLWQHKGLEEELCWIARFSQDFVYDRVMMLTLPSSSKVRLLPGGRFLIKLCVHRSKMRNRFGSCSQSKYTIQMSVATFAPTPNQNTPFKCP